jgi:hypothetical protein
MDSRCSDSGEQKLGDIGRKSGGGKERRLSTIREMHATRESE